MTSYSGRLSSICLGIMVEVLLVIWRGKGKLAAKRAVWVKPAAKRVVER